MSDQSTLFAIHPTCEVCGDDLVKIRPGLVCMRGCGRIKPLEEMQDTARIPLDLSRVVDIKQNPTAQMLRQVEAAFNAIRRAEKREAKAKAAEERRLRREELTHRKLEAAS